MSGGDFDPRAWLAASGLVRQAHDDVWLPADGVTPFAYSDGAQVEASLLDTLRAVSDRSVLSPELAQRIVDWPTRYHLSPLRANLLRPLAGWLQGRRVLEVGAGCGALTRYLAEAGARVVALEGSPVRARLTSVRVRGMAGVAVAALPFQTLPAQPDFDVVTLVGVLEYARIYFPAAEGEDPVDAMLAHARAFLRPGGTLLVAIENQLGLKYLAGYPEDHVAQSMFGVEDRYRADGVVTFGRRELGRRVAAHGLTVQEWLFPFPDYKLPVAVLTGRGVDGGDGVDMAPLAMASVAGDALRPPHAAFALERAWRPVFRNGLGGDLANSLMLLASPAGLPRVLGDDVLGWHYATQRVPAFAKEVCFRAGLSGVWVDARRLAPNLPARSGGVVQHVSPAMFEPGRLWSERLQDLLDEPGWTVSQLTGWARVWLETVLREGEAGAKLDATLPGRLVDALPRNLMVGDGSARFIDLEWELCEGVSLGHLCYRAIVLTFITVLGVAPPAAGTPLRALALFQAVMAGLGMTVSEAQLRAWHAREADFQMVVNGLAAWYGYDEFAACHLPLRARAIW